MTKKGINLSMPMRQTYEETLQSQLHQIDRQLERMAAQMDKAGSDAKTRYEEELADLRHRRRSLAERFQALQNAGDSAWQDMKSGLENAVNELSQAAGDAKRHFEKVIE